MLRLGVLLTALALLLALAGAAPGQAEPGADRTAARPSPGVAAATGATERAAAGRARPPRLRVGVVARGLDIPWDVRPIGGGRLLVTERDRKRLLLLPRRGPMREVRLLGGRIWSSGETGLMGLEVDPGFARNGRIYTCSGWTREGGRHDIRVVRWVLNDAGTRARLDRTLVRGIPISGGRHGGCRLLIARNGALLVGTGDAADPRHAQNRRSLGGKVLRVNRVTGRPWGKNPWAGSSGNRRYVLTYGHRNVQGLAQRADGSVWSVEHGTYRDDEVNLLRGGRNYGWRAGPGYDESPPMTNHRLPGRQWNARWRSGTPTIATSGAAFVPRRGWRGFGGDLAVAALAGERLVFLDFGRAGRLTAQRVRLKGTHGRLRSVTTAGRSLLVTTSNGGGQDKILRIRPRR